MLPEVLDRATEPFFTTKETGHGTVGLSQVHGFVSQSHGFLIIDSSPGEGTRVRLLQVHDELLFEVPEAEADDTARVVKGVMEGACAPHCELSVPLVVETGRGRNWEEAH